MIVSRGLPIVAAIELISKDALYVCALHINTLTLGLHLPTMYNLWDFVDASGLPASPVDWIERQRQIYKRLREKFRLSAGSSRHL